MHRANSLAWLQSTYHIILLVILAGVVFHAPLSVFFGDVLPEYELIIKAWKELLLGAAALILIVLLTARRAWQLALSDKLLWLVVGYALLHLVMVFVFPNALTSELAGLLIDLRYLAFFVLIYLGLRLQPVWRRLYIKTTLIAALVSLVFAALQILLLPRDILAYIGYGPSTIMPYLTIDQNEQFVRINGTLRGPNPLGAYAAIVISLLVSWLIAMRWQLAKKQWLLAATLGVSAGLALWASYSRSAVIAAAIGLAVVLFIRYRHLLTLRIWIVGLLILGALVSGVVLARDTAFVSNVVLHADPNEGNELNSNQAHWTSLEHGTQRMLDQPLGSGIGSTGSASLHGDRSLIIENQYLFIAHETSWLGLLMFLVIMGLILHGLWRRRSDYLALGVLASGIGMSAIAMIQPVWVDDTVSLVWFGLAAVALAGTVGKQQKS